MKHSPPKGFHRFFLWFCRPSLVDYIEGDLIELFNEKARNSGLFKAKLMFIWEVLKLLKPSIIKPIGGDYRLNLYGLAIHNFLMFLRIFKRDRTYGIFNLLGLTLGSVAFVFILQYTNFEKKYDRFHSNYPNLYRINYTYEGDGAVRSFATCPSIFAPFIAANIPEIKSGVRMGNAGDGTFAYQDKKFLESNILFVDPNFLQVFSFDLINGNPLTCLNGVRKIVMTETMSKKYFGDQNPIGKVVEVNNTKDKFTVTGVVQDVPANSHIQFDFLISYWWYDEMDRDSWYSHDYHSYVVLESQANVEFVNNKIQALITSERGEVNSQHNFKQSVRLQTIGDIHFNSHFEKELNPEKQGSRFTVNTLFYIGCFILIMAWINYINMATSRAIKRAKEVGVRKTLGAFRWQLIFQFMLESFLMNLVGLVLAVLIISLGLDNLNSIFGTTLSFDSIWNVSTWATLLLIQIIGSLGAGIYPAFVLSAFQPNKVLKSSALITGTSGRVRKVLMTFQYGASTTLIAAIIIIFIQLDHIRGKNLGFDINNLLVVNLPNEGNHKLFINELTRLTDVKSATITQSIPGEPVIEPTYIKKKNTSAEKAVSFDVFHVGQDFFKTLKIDLITGRTLNKQFQDSESAVVLNKAAITQLGYNNPQQAIGETIVINYKYPRKIVGVVSDFHHLTAKVSISPMIYAFDTEWGNYCIIRYNNFQTVLDEADELFQSIYTNAAFDYFVLDEFYKRQYTNDRYLSNIVFTFSGISIFIACIGLIGLMLYSIEKRKKEISLRKVFGASVSRIIYLLSKENIRLIIIASALTIPIVYYFCNQWLNTFTYRIEIHFYVFLVACLVMLSISLLTSISMIFKTANANPTNSLRNE